MNKSASLAIAAFAASAARLCLADAPVFATPFTAHAVLQRDCALPVWGTAQPGSAVTVALDDQRDGRAARPCCEGGVLRRLDARMAQQFRKFEDAGARRLYGSRWSVSAERSAALRGLSAEGANVAVSLLSPEATSCSTLQPGHSRKAW